jgi:flavin-dependent dehydrogenase
MSDICVVGAGPAGSVFAARMAQFGHQVTIVERARFPRSHLGESVSAGVLPLLETIGARKAVEGADFGRLRNVRVKWDGPLQIREDPAHEGLLVDRGEFDRILLERARSLGVRVLMPARVRGRRKDDRGWLIDAVAEEGAVELRADFLAEATGRSAGLSDNRRRTGCRTVALYAYWRGQGLPDEPCIEAGCDAWYWGVPIPDGSYNTLVFVDARHFSAAPKESLTARFLQLLERSGLAAACRAASLAGPVRAADATPYLERGSVTRWSIKVGEAALAIDPISSSGVQKAIQSALAAAVVANTLLQKPQASDVALEFYRVNLADASERHRRWAARHYRLVAARSGGTFWEARASYADWNPPSLPRTPVNADFLAAIPVRISRHLEFVDLPCIEGEFVTVKQALRHPNLESPIAYLGRWDLAPLIRRWLPGSTPLQQAQSWSNRIPLPSGLAVATWLINNGILVCEPER